MISLNRILTDIDRENLKPIIDQMYQYIPEMTHNKIHNALVQQAFVFGMIMDVYDSNNYDYVLNIGGYQDTAGELLRFLGYAVYDIDPSFNCDLATFKQRAPVKYPIIMATSVLEHVQDDEQFIVDICELLANNGIAVLTCDFKDDWRTGDRVPYTSNRFYRKEDLLQRLPTVFRKYGCEFIDTPNYDDKDNFVYDGIEYSFATFVFKRVK